MAAKPASASSLATSRSLRLALVAPSRTWAYWVFSSSEALCAAWLIFSKPSVALRTPIWANSRDALAGGLGGLVGVLDDVLDGSGLGGHGVRSCNWLVW